MERDSNENMKKLSVEISADHLFPCDTEIDFSSKISSLRASESNHEHDEGCGCDEGCVEDCKCECHKASRKKLCEQSQAIEYSNRIIEALNDKAKEFNKSQSSRRVRLSRLKEVYRSSVQGHKENKNLFAFARVNKFLEVVSDFSSLDVKNLKLSTGELDLLGNWSASDEDLALAKKDIEKYNLDFNFASVDDLFIETPKSHIEYEIEY